MNGRGPYQGNASFDAEERSGVSSLAPVPARPVRLSGLDENDRTQYFSVGSLLERGKALVAREQEQPTQQRARVVPEPVSPPPRGAAFWRQLGEASLARKASALLLPVLIALVLVKPVFKKERPAAAPAPVSAVADSAPAPLAPKIAATPAEPPSLPRGVTLEKAAADAISAGDFKRALSLYRELARRDPAASAYAEAARILERRERAQEP